MPVVDVLRPASASGGATWTPVGAANIYDTVNDDSDATYDIAPQLTYALFNSPAHSLAAGYQRHRMRGRTRARAHAAVGGVWPTLSLLAFGPNSSLYNIVVTATEADYATPWVYFNPGDTAGEPRTFHYTHYIDPAPAGSSLRIVEAYWDVDTRAQPTFTADVFDAAGVSRDGGTVSDTSRPVFSFGTLDYDGLTARRWTLTVLDAVTAEIVFEAAATGVPPDEILSDPLLNGSYIGYFYAYSTIRLNDEYASDLQIVTFDVDFAPPDPPPLTVTPNGCADLSGVPHASISWPAYELSPPSPGSPPDPVFDDDPVIEIRRTDCNGSRSIYVGASSVECICDRFMGLTNDPDFCEDTRGIRLTLNGDASATTGGASLAALGPDMEFQAMVDPLTWRPGVGTNNPETILQVRDPAGNNPYVNLFVHASGTLFLAWSDGVNPEEQVLSTEPVAADAGRIAVKATFDGDNGAGGHDVGFEYSVDGGATWRALGETVVNAGTVDLFAASATLDLIIGRRVDGFPFRGDIDWVRVLDGIGGTTLADPDFTSTAQGWRNGDNAGDTGTDGQGLVYTLNDDAEITVGVCLVFYEARYWGEVSGVLVATPWRIENPVGFGLDPDIAVTVANSAPGSDWIRGGVGGDMAICPDRTYSTVRPFGAFQPIGGGIPTVVTGSPGGRDYQLVFGVESESDLVDVESILAQAVVFYQPEDAHDVWLAPNPESVEVVKVGRVRMVTAGFVQVERQPVPDPESFF